jgi:hypothetical protein
MMKWERPKAMKVNSFEWRTQRVSAKKQAGIDLSSDPRQKSNQEKRSGD